LRQGWGGVPASLIYRIADILEDPQYRTRAPEIDDLRVSGVI
jgi:hypothetical protein